VFCLYRCSRPAAPAGARGAKCNVESRNRFPEHDKYIEFRQSCSQHRKGQQFAAKQWPQTEFIIPVCLMGIDWLEEAY